MKYILISILFIVSCDTKEIETTFWHFETFSDPNSDNYSTYNPIKEQWDKGNYGQGLNVIVHVANVDINNSFINFDKDLSFDDFYPNLPFVIDEGLSPTEKDLYGNTYNNYWHDTQVASLVRQVAPKSNIIAVRLGGGTGYVPGIYKSLLKIDAIATELLNNGEKVIFISSRFFPYNNEFIDDWAKNAKYRIFLASPRPSDVTSQTGTLPNIYTMDNVTMVGSVDLNNKVPPYNTIRDDMSFWRIYQGVYTSDYEGSLGHNAGDFIPNFDGSSAATPIYGTYWALKNLSE